MQEQTKIGVFLCQCGGKISDRLDLMAVGNLIKDTPGVTHLDTLPYPCLSPGLASIQAAIERKGLNRVVLGGCSARVMKKKFITKLSSVGIRKPQLDLVNLKEHVAQVHEERPEELARKAAALLSGAIASMNTLVPQDPVKVVFEGPTLILGDGIAGFMAARELARNGMEAVIATNAQSPEEVLDRLCTTYPGTQLQRKEICELVKEAFDNSKVSLIPDRPVVSVTGRAGEYRIAFQNGNNGVDEVCGAAMIVALDREYGRSEEVLFGGKGTIMDLVELETIMLKGELQARDIVFWIKEGDGEGKATQLAFHAAWQDSLNLVQSHRNVTCKVLYPAGLTLPITGADLRLARTLDIGIQAYHPDVKPLIQAGYLTYVDPEDHLEHEMEWETLVLSPVPRPFNGIRRDLLQWLPVKTENGTGLKKMSARVRPEYAPRDGIFVVGSACGLCTLNEAVRQGKRAAREVIKLRREASDGGLFSAPTVVTVEEQLCEGCGLCGEICPCGGIEKMISLVGGVPRKVDPLACAGCGTCAASCPYDAMKMVNNSTQQLNARVRAILSRMKEDEALAFACNWGGVGAADLAGERHLSYSSRLCLVPVNCLGSVDPTILSMSLLEGAKGVLMIGCPPGICHYNHGVDHSWTRINFVKKLLQLAGVERQRLAISHVDVNQADEFAKLVESFLEIVDDLGPLPTDETTRSRLMAVHATLHRPRVRWVLGVGLRRPAEEEYPADQRNALEFEATTWEILKEEFLASRIMSCVSQTPLDPRQIAQRLGVKPQVISALLPDMVKEGRLRIKGWENRYPVYAAGF